VGTPSSSLSLPIPYAPPIYPIIFKLLNCPCNEFTTNAMSTLTHSPSHVHSPSDYVAFRSRRIDPDSSFSPCRATSRTPPRRPFIAQDSPLLMLTPSPLRRRADASNIRARHMDPFDHATDFSTPFNQDTFFTSSPNAPARHGRSEQSPSRKANGPTRDEGEGSFLLDDTPARAPLIMSHAINAPSVVSPTHAPKRKVCVCISSIPYYC
jgi:hypothetical protein